MFRQMLCWIIAVLAYCSVTSGFALPSPVPVDQAFVFSANLINANTLAVTWRMLPNYHLYRKSVRFIPFSDSHVGLGTIELPAGTRIDTAIGTMEYYADILQLKVPLRHPDRGELHLKIVYQGCMDAGYCYAPVTKMIQINLLNLYPPTDIPVTTLSFAVKASKKSGWMLLDAAATEALFAGHSGWIILLSFFGIGILLSFTPCVLPMIPILAGIIIGQKSITHLRAFSLSLAYVLGMTISYALLGVIAALVGKSVQPFLEQTWVIVLFSLVFIALAFSLFGFYELHLPHRLRQTFARWYDHLRGGTLWGAFAMGAFSIMVVSPCVSAPLVGVLAYIAHTGDMFLGAFALLAMGFGMGIPLLLIGTGANKLLPRVGAWSVSLQKFMGVMLLAVAIILLARILAGPAILVLWALFCIITAVFLGVFRQAQHPIQRIRQGFCVVLLVYGIILLTGAAMGNDNPLRPLDQVKSFSHEALPWHKVTNYQALITYLNQAKQQKQPVLIDYYADWCTSCWVMDKTIFQDEAVVAALTPFLLLHVDVTPINAETDALLYQFNVVAPPTILFVNRNGRELPSLRLTGEVLKSDFLENVQKTWSE